ncbi:NrdH-redoxin [Candidatus Falkowbacteria bacterium RIFOXYC2_FULL_47_12]|uniref:NrdH-redoxin n=2 Tax=Candidatus Falkowiibacteriota TaxID=1752728 RepID=A0A1F5TMU0_9BACT|nr:MAG: NrdH-redoxin [Candidatus Falkowbacteria bacterium RIFOXYA2_FULL_47_9]OGF40144.1 MAG: NrdH-redoxin [Candidatus Falkowbacteria bacterium RIFOXYC2_FULL_47_12]
MPAVTIYTTPMCTYCRTAKEYFKAHNVAYMEKDVTQDMAAQQEMVQKSGQLGVPVIDVDGQIVLGFDQQKLQKLLRLS